MNKRWICNDVWMDIFPLFDRAQLGLKMALLSERFDVLVDTHFDGRELTIWQPIGISKDIGPKPKLSVRIDVSFVDFPLSDHPLPNKICFKNLRIEYIDYSVIEFLRSNKQIWDKSGTKLKLSIVNNTIWDVFTHEIWPVFATNIRHLVLHNADHLDNLRRRISPTILTDLNHLNSIESTDLFPDVIADDGQNATACQMLSNWLHTPSKNGQPKRLHCHYLLNQPNLELVNNFKEAFPRATSSASYIIRIDNVETMPIGPFESVNERTKEKLTLMDDGFFYLLLKRCPIGETEATVQWENDENLDDKLNKVKFALWRGKCFGPFSPPTEEKEKADE